MSKFPFYTATCFYTFDKRKSHFEKGKIKKREHRLGLPTLDAFLPPPFGDFSLNLRCLCNACHRSINESCITDHGGGIGGLKERDKEYKTSCWSGWALLKYHIWKDNKRWIVMVVREFKLNHHMWMNVVRIWIWTWPQKWRDSCGFLCLSHVWWARIPFLWMSGSK